MKLISFFVALIAIQFSARAQNNPAADSLPPAFRTDSANTAAIRALEAGRSVVEQRAAAVSASANVDSLDIKLRRRHPFLGAALSFAFADLSAKQLFADQMNTVVARDTLRVQQTQDPVAIYFPAGLIASYPLFPYLDVWLRTESFWYKQSGLAEGTGTGAKTRKFWYAVQGDLFGVGVRYLVPVSLLSVNNHPGLYAAYTRFWNFGPTGIYTSSGHVRAKTDPAGAGYEVQAGFQQDFDKRWTWTGGLTFSNFSFESGKSWTAILPDGPNETAKWDLKSLRLCLQGFYQFGRENKKP